MGTVDPLALPREFFYSCDVDLPVRIKIMFVEGNRPRAKFQELLDDPFRIGSNLAAATKTTQNGQSSSESCELFVTVQLFSENKPMTMPMRTNTHSPDSNGRWEEWVVLPIKVADLPQSSQVAITVWDLYAPRRYVPVGGTTFRLFTRSAGDRASVLKEGKHKLYLWPDREPDGNQQTRTPSKTAGMEEISLQQKLMKRYDNGEIAKIDWLDALTFQRHKESLLKASIKSDQQFLHVQLPKFDYPVLFEEKQYDEPVSRRFSQLVLIQDAEALRDSPIEAKHLRLARGHRSSPIDRDLRPNTDIRNQLAQIQAYPPTRAITSSEKDLLWKFRFYITREKKALTKFLRCVVWEEKLEEKQALELLKVWAPIDMEDALELLSPAFRNRAVRAHAVSRLNSVGDEELHLYLLQLVQALKYEDLRQRNIGESALATFLITRAVQSSKNILYNYLFWYLKVEAEDKSWNSVYSKVSNEFMYELVKGPQGSNRFEILQRQMDLCKRLSEIHAELGSLNRKKKIERLKQILADPKSGFASFAPLPLPLDPSVRVTGIISETAYIYKSAKLPFFLAFRTEDQKEYSVMFKQGDDIRQDQLVIQIIELMDRLLRQENLDLQLTPYRVLATAVNQGLLQFVDAEPLSKILEENNNDLQAFLRKHNPDPSADYGIAPAVMDTFLKSCAGYCVVTFLLGVGDRHLDNLLLSKSGNLIHIDFGHILGKDPKLFPPPMKLCPEMVQCMGGLNSNAQRDFRKHCFTAFNALRKSANLILNLFSLMIDSNVSDIRDDPDKAVFKVQENFQLNKTDEEAIAYFRDLINVSMNAMIPQMFETMHKMAQYWRT